MYLVISSWTLIVFTECPKLSTMCSRSTHLLYGVVFTSQLICLICTNAFISEKLILLEQDYVFILIIGPNCKCFNFHCNQGYYVFLLAESSRSSIFCWYIIGSFIYRIINHHYECIIIYLYIINLIVSWAVDVKMWQIFILCRLPLL